jgi:hypothetical protein
MRVMHEAQLHQNNCFITLTYDEKHLPADRNLVKRDFQLFIKRLRKKLAPAKVRYYMAGEYGEKYGRPHYHACNFGWDPSDKQFYKKTASGSIIYTSKELEDCWSIENRNTGKKELIGFTSVGTLTFESAAYTARYIMEKNKGKVIMDDYGTSKWVPDNDKYVTYDPITGEVYLKQSEYNKMSLKPGIGAEWIKKFKNDVYPNDYVVVRGKKMKPPKAYDKWYKNNSPYEYDELLYKRETNAKLNPDNHDPKRLDAKRQILESRLSLLKRTLT